MCVDTPDAGEWSPELPAVSAFAAAPSGFVSSEPLCLSLTRRKKNMIRKTITLVRLKRINKHQVITDIIVKLNGEAECSIPSVAARVKDEVGFDVILMNTKCNQITDSEATSGLDFWKSSSAVHAEMFDKFFGKLKAYSTAIDLTQSSTESSDDSQVKIPPAKR